MMSVRLSIILYQYHTNWQKLYLDYIVWAEKVETYVIQTNLFDDVKYRKETNINWHNQCEGGGGHLIIETTPGNL